MEKIVIEKPSVGKLQELGVYTWPIWKKSVSRFDWSYTENEMCYILEGKATVTPKTGNPVIFGAGDLVTFPAGLNCTWEILQPVKKHYKMG